jgi:hypothetical protein
MLLRLGERDAAGEGHRRAERLAADHGLRGGKRLVFKAVADRTERRTALQAWRREVHGSHALVESVRLISLSEGVEIGGTGEGASGPTRSLKLGFGAAAK